MKKSLLLIIIFTIFLSCRNDDNSSDTKIVTTDLVGEWKIESLKVNGHQVSLGSCSNFGEFIFNENSNAIERTLEVNQNGIPDIPCRFWTERYLRWYVSENRIVWDGLQGQPSYNWYYEFEVINKNKLIIYGDDSYEYTVVKQ